MIINLVFIGIVYKHKLSYTLAKYIALLGILTAFGFTGVILAIYITDPCCPPLLLSIIFTSNHGECFYPHFMVTGIIGLVDLWIWQNVVFGAALNASFLFSLAINFMVDGSAKIMR